MILGIETSAGQCAVALLGDKAWSKSEPMDRGHAEALFPMIEALLSDANASFDDLTRIAVCTGPGSFTGLRIGIAAARGLALGCGIPAIGITRLEAIAAETGASQIRLPGRGGQVYVQNFRNGVALDAPRIEDGTGDDLLASPEIIARLSADRDTTVRPAPLYLRGADADPPRDAPPVILDA